MREKTKLLEENEDVTMLIRTDSDPLEKAIQDKHSTTHIKE